MAKTNAPLRPHEFWKSASELHYEDLEPKFPLLEVPAFKHLFIKGLTRGEIVEFNGSRSSGRTSASHYFLAQSTAGGEVCAVVDLNSTFNPHAAAASGVLLDHLVWIKCNRNMEHALRSTDLLLHAGGFGIVLLDLCEAPARALNRIPLSFWYRFRRVIEHTPTILLICADSLQAKSCTRNHLQIKSKAFHWTGHASCKLLESLEVIASTPKAAHARVTSIRPEPLLLPVA